MAAHVSLTGHKSTLILENIDDLLVDITCNPDSITLQAIPSAYPKIYDMLNEENEFYIITSHETCNQEGSRIPHL